MSGSYDEVNIFFTHLNPTIAAEFACDAHVRKMVVESTQMLANAYYMDNAAHSPPPKADGSPYTKSHWNHPCAVWVREDYKHWDWLRMHAYGLANEFERRFGKKHECWNALNYMTENNPLPWMVHKHFVCPPLCMPDKFHSRVASPIGCYRNYIIHDKRHLHSWTNREPPMWLMAPDKLRTLADSLIEKCDLACFDADDYRAELAPDLPDDEWNAAVALANDSANGRDMEGSEAQLELAEAIFQASKLELLGADQHRASLGGHSEAEWKLIKYLATEFANGRDPLRIPDDWNFSNYRG